MSKLYIRDSSVPQYAVVKIGDSGWYSFKSIPQGYIKVDCLRCVTDLNALKQANRLLNANGVSGRPVIIS